MSLSRSPMWTHRAGAPCRRTEQGHGLAQALEPADALLGLDGHARRIDLALERGGALELLPRPELHGREAQWQTFRRHRKGGVHEKATDRVHPEAAGFVLTAVHAAGDADRLGALALERELGGVLDHQNGAVRRGEAVARGLEMAGEDLRLADPIIGEEAVSRLRVRPVLACERQASPDRAPHTLDEFAQALAQTLVHEHASGELALPPGVDCRVHGAPHPQVTWCPTRNHAQSRPRNPSSPLLKMWVIESLTGRLRVAFLVWLLQGRRYAHRWTARFIASPEFLLTPEWR